MDIREKILTLTKHIGPTKTICPSEVARALWPTGWQDHMEDVRRVACELHREGLIDITQKGSPVTDLNFKGPIRLKIK